MSNNINNSLFEYCLRLGDDRVILGQRMAEWCGKGPILEEDLALANISLDLFGQSILFLKYAAELEGKGNDEDALAYNRNERQYKNLLLTEQPNGDFAYTIARQFFFDCYEYYFYYDLVNSKNETLAAIAAKSIKETIYHLRHSSEWMLRLGDGTEESHNRVQYAVNHLWCFTGEMFEMDTVDEYLLKEGIAVDLAKVKAQWNTKVAEILTQATLEIPPTDTYMIVGGRNGIHTEHLGHLLSEMQILTRTYPGAKW